MSTPRAVRIGLETSEGSDDPRALSRFTSYEFSMGSWMSTSAQPTWLEHPAAWVVSVDPGWVVSFRVDLTAAGVDIAAPFRIALGLHAENPRSLERIGQSWEVPPQEPRFVGNRGVPNPIVQLA